MPDYLQIITTTASEADAEKIAAALVDRRLAACVQISGPIQSTYRWRGAVETAQEWRLTIKTRTECYEKVEEAIKSLHPYEVPEIIAVGIVTASGDYLGWIDEQVE